MKQIKNLMSQYQISQNDGNGSRPVISLSVTITVIAAFFTLSGGLWHLGFWTTFNFNYFEYANYTDLFKSSLYPFFSGTWLLIGMGSFFIGAFYFGMVQVSRLENFKTETSKKRNTFQKVN